MLRRRLAARLQPPLLELGQIDPDGLQVAPLGVNSHGVAHDQLSTSLWSSCSGWRVIVNEQGRVILMTADFRVYRGGVSVANSSSSL